MLSQVLFRSLSTYCSRMKELRRQATYPIVQEGLVYHCPLTLRRRHNLAAQHINKDLLAWQEVALPHILHVGVTSVCNLRCPACPTGTHALGRPGAHLDFDVYARVVRELRHTLLFMLFWDWGEPLLHPRLADMVALARQYGIRTVVSTNATVTNTLERMERLTRAAPDVVIACVDGASQSSYERYRIGGSLATVLDAIRHMARLKRELRATYPVIEFRSLATRFNEAEMPDLLHLAQQTGADVFSVKTLRPYDYRGTDVDNELVPLDPALARYAYEQDASHQAGRRIQPRGPLRCGKPMYAPTLNSDGNLVFCSYAGREEEHFGSVVGRSVKGLWRSQPARSKRLAFLHREGTRSCETCYFRTDHKPTMLYTVPLRPLPPGVSLVKATSEAEFLKAARASIFTRSSNGDQRAAG